ncbi:MAG: hypothetical protein ACR2OC_01310 [Solirubrobacterales bacterium]
MTSGPAPRRIDGGSVLAALGALLVLVSLFLDWFAPGLSAWTVFESLDMVLAAIAIATLAGVVPRLLARGASARALVPEGLLPVLGVAAFVVVGIQLLNHPPAAIGRDEEVGAWLALAGATLLLIGTTLVRTRVTISMSRREPSAGTTSETTFDSATDRPDG